MNFNSNSIISSEFVAKYSYHLNDTYCYSIILW